MTVHIKRQWGTETSNAFAAFMDQINKQLADRAAHVHVQLYRSSSPAGLAIGSVSKKTLKIVNTVTFLINGVPKSKATAAVAFTDITHDIAADAAHVKEAVYLVSLATDGTPTITMGVISAGAGTAAIPATPAANAPIGYARIAVAAGATPFNATGDDLDAVHLTVTYVDLAVNPTDLVPTAEAIAEIA